MQRVISRSCHRRWLRSAAGDSPRGLAEQIELADMPVYIHHAVRYVDINGHMEFYCAIYLHFFGLRIIITA